MGGGVLVQNSIGRDNELLSQVACQFNARSNRVVGREDTLRCGGESKGG